MGLRKYRDLIETFEFGAQFSIFSGFSLVLAAMDENEILQQLIGELRSSKIRRKSLLNMVTALLGSKRSDSQMAFDGCIAAYMYCLWKADLETGNSASSEVLKTPDLWWAAKLALLVRQDYLNDQIAKSLRCRSVEGEPHQYVMTGHDFPVFKGMERYVVVLSALGRAPDRSRGYRHEQFLAEPIDRENAVPIASSGRLEFKDYVGPIQEVQMSTAS